MLAQIEPALPRLLGVFLRLLGVFLGVFLHDRSLVPELAARPAAAMAF